MKTLPYALCLALLTSAASAAPLPTPLPAVGPGHATAVEVRTKRAHEARPYARSYQATRTSRTTPFDASNCTYVPLKCSKARNCADAKRALACGVTKLDPDKDGIPCEGLCR